LRVIRVRRLVLAVLAAGSLAVLVAERSSPAVETFGLIFVSILIEALPFVLLGAFVSALLATFVPTRIFEGLGRLPLPIQVPAVALSGMAFPVCECASVPVARQLISRGVHPAAGVAFMLAAPVVNPIVLLTTALAYSGRGLALVMVGGRAALGLTTALVVGLLTARASGEQSVLRPRPGDDEHDHDHGSSRRSRVAHAADHVVTDGFGMGRMIVLGAAAAALFQVVVSQGAVASLTQVPVLAIVTMMCLAFALSLCSEADAFVAASFTGAPLAAQLAFLTFGPIADFKLALLYGGTFRRETALRIVLGGALVVFTGSLWFWVVFR
jgi:uncharacterized membrane protein YraQ (UPF0718 family)